MECEINPIFGVLEYTNPQDWNEVRWLEQKEKSGRIERIDPITWRERL